MMHQLFLLYVIGFYLVATMMLGALTAKVIIIMEGFQISIVILLMLYFSKSSEDIFYIVWSPFSLVFYVYAVVALNRKNGEESYENAKYMYAMSTTDGFIRAFKS
ncbi:MAG: hypothetical protein U5K55_06980 [Aliarcobacter sp.]|nr:hypothetical protein [Aliarcobacter sp.]